MEVNHKHWVNDLLQTDRRTFVDYNEPMLISVVHDFLSVRIMRRTETISTCPCHQVEIFHHQWKVEASSENLQQNSRTSGTMWQYCTSALIKENYNAQCLT